MPFRVSGSITVSIIAPPCQNAIIQDRDRNLTECKVGMQAIESNAAHYPAMLAVMAAYWDGSDLGLVARRMGRGALQAANALTLDELRELQGLNVLGQPAESVQ